MEAVEAVEVGAVSGGGPGTHRHTDRVHRRFLRMLTVAVLVYVAGHRQEHLHSERCGGRDQRQTHQEESGGPALPAPLQRTASRARQTWYLN